MAVYSDSDGYSTVSLTCELSGVRIPATFHDELTGSVIESASSETYEVVFTPKNETRVTCTIYSSAKSDALSIVGKSTQRSRLPTLAYATTSQELDMGA